MYKKSEQLLERALKSIPLASQTFSKSLTQYPKGVSPFFIEKGKGSKVWDVDGNEYIDFVNSLAAVTLGYCDADVDKVGIGTANPAAKLHVEGDARFRASVEVCTSDPAPANTETGTIYQFTKGSAGVFTLPASPPVGTQFVLVNGDGQDIVITRPHSSVKINGATSNVTNTTAYAATSIVAVVSNGNNSEWLAFGGI